jgi:serine/threonine protein kinase
MGEEAKRYVRVCDLAEGGIGSVAIALRRENGVRRLYAVKHLQAHHRDDPDVRTMFLDEARIARLVDHPNVVNVLDVGHDDEGPYLVMAYVDGVDLGRIAARANERGERLPVQACVRIAMEVAVGLHAAHELRDHDGTVLELVHRDLTPQNVLVSYDGKVRITDFGIAKALGRSTRTATGVLKGKIGYMAPEQLRFEDPDRRSDLFALGVILYEILTGVRLYEKSGGSSPGRRILDEPAPDVRALRPEVSAGVASILSSLLSKARAARPPNAQVLVDLFEIELAALALSEGAVDLRALMKNLYGEAMPMARAFIEKSADEAERRAGGGHPSPRLHLLRAAIGAVIVATVVTAIALYVALS